MQLVRFWTEIPGWLNVKPALPQSPHSDLHVITQWHFYIQFHIPTKQGSSYLHFSVEDVLVKCALLRVWMRHHRATSGPDVALANRARDKWPSVFCLCVGEKQPVWELWRQSCTESGKKVIFRHILILAPNFFVLGHIMYWVNIQVLRRRFYPVWPSTTLITLT